MTLDELLPLVRDARTAREFGSIVVRSVPTRDKHRLARAARDALDRQWSDTTLRHYLAPAIAGVRPYRDSPPLPPQRPKPRRDFPPTIRDPVALVEAAWVEPAASDTQRLVVVRLIVRMVYLNAGSTNLPRGWIPALGARLAASGRDVSPTILRWFRAKVQDDPMAFELFPGVDVSLLVTLEDRFLK